MRKPRGSIVKSHQWTKEEIQALSKLWNSATIDEIAEELGVAPQQVVYMGAQIRMVYPNLVPKKHRKGYTRNLIKEALGK